MPLTVLNVGRLTATMTGDKLNLPKQMVILGMVDGGHFDPIFFGDTKLEAMIKQP